MLPKVFVLGAAKSGTTTLARWLSQYDDVYVPEEKELHFFSNEKRYSLGLEFYSSFYQGNKESITVDATPAYFHLPDILLPRLKEAYRPDQLAQLKFIIVLRDPSERAFSHYKHRCRLLKETRDFSQVITDEKKHKEWMNYVSDGFYAEQLSKWFNCFDKRQFLILITDELKSDPENVLCRISAFLKVKNSDVDLSESANAASKPKSDVMMRFLTKPNFFKSCVKFFISEKARKPVIEKLIRWNLSPEKKTTRLSKQDRAKLIQVYSNDIDKLSEMLNRDLSKWKNL